jgi:hypothetical protein
MSPSANSPAYTEFLQQLNATGYAVGSGFNPKWFDDMTDVEKRRAEASLVDALQKGNTTVAHALGQLATASAIQALRQCLQQAQLPSYASAEMAAALWNATHDLAYQDLLTENLTIPSDLIRVAITVNLQSTGHTTKLLDTFIGLAEADPYDTVRSSSAKGAYTSSACFQIVRSLIILIDRS